VEKTRQSTFLISTKKNIQMEKSDLRKLNIDQTNYVTRLSKRYAARKPYAPAVLGIIFSFIPGTVIEILVKVGDRVTEGDDLIILDAMKMKNRLKSHVSGTVTAININPGDRVAKGVVLMEIK